MPRVAPPADVEKAIEDYVAGMSSEDSSARWRVSEKRLRTVLAERGLLRSRAESYALGSRKVAASLLAKSPLSKEDEAAIVERYKAGESTNRLAKEFGVARNVIDRRLKDAGVELRTQTSANQLMASLRTPEENRRLMFAAQAAQRGKPKSDAALLAGAAAREESERWTPAHSSPQERQLATWVSDRGVRVTLQKAVGPYNVDLATDAVAVEIFGGGWHGYGLHHARAAKRFRYILDQGWALVIVWTSRNRHPLQTAAADYVATFAKLASGDPSLRGQYRVIWGDGKEAPIDGLNVDNLSDIPTRSGRRWKRTLDYRS